MPSYVTHKIFVKEVYSKLNKSIKDTINLDVFYAFSESHDYLFYSLKKDIRVLGHYAHKNNTQDYIINIINYIKDNDLYNNCECIGYLYGIISHYVLDSVCHPFIRKKSRSLSKSSKYKGIHREIERNIDSLYYEKYNGTSLCRCNNVYDKVNFSDDLNRCIDYAYKETYDVSDVSMEYSKSIKNYKSIYKMFYKDKSGIKRCVYKPLSWLFKYNLTCLSNNIKNCDDYLVCGKEVFDDYFNLSIKKCVSIIKKVDMYFNDKISLEELKKIIPNISYSTGLEL